MGWQIQSTSTISSLYGEKLNTGGSHTERQAWKNTDKREEDSADGYENDPTAEMESQDLCPFVFILILNQMFAIETFNGNYLQTLCFLPSAVSRRKWGRLQELHHPSF